MDKLTNKQIEGILEHIRGQEVSTHPANPYIESLMVELLELRAAYVESGATPEQVQEWAKAAQEGRLVVLPCKVGDMVYWISRFGTGINQGSVTDIRVSAFGFDLCVSGGERNRLTTRRESEKVFFTREEAEATLKGAITDENNCIPSWEDHR